MLFLGISKIITMRWSLWKASLFLILFDVIIKISIATASQNFKISPKPCIVGEVGGTCMFVWECIKSEGTHLGMCMDGFMFGSCCGHNLTDNFILPPSTPFRPPNKPTNKYKPTKNPSQHTNPIVSHETLTIQRPNGSGTLVIRQTPHPQKIKTTTNATKKPSSTTTKNPFDIFNDSSNELSASESVSTNYWTSTPWQLSTEPNFITKPKPSIWDKTTLEKQKPTKKPILFSTLNDTPTRKPTTFKPRPPVKPVKPSLETTAISRRPTTTTLATLSTTSTTSPSSISSSEILENTISVEQSLFSTSPGRDTISAARNYDCGVSSASLARPEVRIVGGKNAGWAQYPWQVSVRRTSFFGFSSTHRCGGAVLNENFIATAGHCVDDLLTSQIRIRVGEYDFSHIQEQLPYIERAISKKIVHPKYNFYTYEYDLALVKLEQPLEFAPHIIPICLPATEDLLVGENATLTGWGRLSEGGTLPSVLQEVTVPIVSNDRCKSMFLRAGRHEFIPEIFLCAGHDLGKFDSCQGDSGGPLQVKGKDGHYFLAGIISWGIGCAEPNLPGVCTRISKFVPWILENVS
ncbi:serine proteinase stubble [Chironomus tepperi]|uniref:serine proteinase stubble n=1 Tax=Chironomus tepperi TaxID=113505 RepID=UPI00391FCAA1